MSDKEGTAAVLTDDQLVERALARNTDAEAGPVVPARGRELWTG